jgi:hypothetical protein
MLKIPEITRLNQHINNSRKKGGEENGGDEREAKEILSKGKKSSFPKEDDRGYGGH